MSKSFDYQDRGRRIIPGMTQLLSKRPDMFSLGVWPGYYQKAKGSRVWDLDGNEYLDMSIGGIGACVLGYADDEVDEAVMRSIRSGVASSLNAPEEVELAECLIEAHPWAEMVRFARGGGEALSMAVRIARAWTGKDVIACCGYHGWQDWYLAANLAEDAALDGHLIPGLKPTGVPRGLQGSVYTFHYNHPEELRDIVARHGKQLAAIVMEPIRSEEPAPGFLEEVRAIADATGAVLIMDEVSSGFRYCLGGAHLVKTSVRPDMAVFSKALGNGYAISAVIGKADIMQAAQQTFISSTNWTERVGFSAGLACMKAYAKRKPYEKFLRFGKQIKRELEDLGREYDLNVAVHGMEAMQHFEFGRDDPQALKSLFIQLMLEEGILASTNCYLMDSHNQEDVDRYLAASRKAFSKMAEVRKSGKVREMLKGQPAQTGFKRLA